MEVCYINITPVLDFSAYIIINEPVIFHAPAVASLELVENKKMETFYSLSQTQHTVRCFH